MTAPPMVHAPVLIFVLVTQAGTAPWTAAPLNVYRWVLAQAMVLVSVPIPVTAMLVLNLSQTAVHSNVRA